MEWDLGLAGLGLLLAMSVGFGLVAQLIAGRFVTRHMWLIGTVGFFALGLLISEGLFGWATEEDLQPNYDGLSFDETLLALFPSIAVVVLVRWQVRRHRAAGRSPTAPPRAHAA